MTRTGLLRRPTFAFPMVATCVLAGAFLVYYFPVTTERERRLDHRAFRSLAAVGDTLSLRIANFVEVLEQSQKRSDLREVGNSFQAGRGSEFVIVRDKTDECKAGSVAAETAEKSGSHRLNLRCAGLAGTVGFDAVLPPLLGDALEQLFDDVLVTDGNGVVLYQQASGWRITRLPATQLTATQVSDPKAAPPANGDQPFKTASQASTLLFAKVAGEDYRAYLVPVTLGVGSADAADTSSRLVIAGLMRTDRFRRSSLAVPGSVAIMPILVALIVIMATWPLFKFAKMSAAERVRAPSAVYLFLSTLGTILVLCILVIHIRYVTDLHVVDEHLRKLADAMERNLDTELTRALRVMDGANSSGAFRDQLAHRQKCDESLRDPRVVPHPVKNLLAHAGVRLSDYPYFERLFWIDSEGLQYAKWETGTPAPATVVKDRPYFSETIADRLWQLAPGGRDGQRFRVDPLYSKNFGQYRAVISRKVDPEPACGRSVLRVQSMVTPLLSLIGPVMPPDYGFAVVDASGKVLFHSVGAKNGQERFLDEVDDAAELRVALYARQSRMLTAQYLGLDHRLFVTPLVSLQQSPWSLIVFHDLSARVTEHFERMVLFAVLAFGYYGAIAFVLLLMPIFRGPREWLWPCADRRGWFLHLAITIAALVLPCYDLLFDVSQPSSVLLIAGLIPAVTIGSAVLKCHRVPVGWLFVALAVVVLCLGVVVVTEPQPARHMIPMALMIVALLVLLFQDTVSAYVAAWPGLVLTMLVICATAVVLPEPWWFRYVAAPLLLAAFAVGMLFLERVPVFAETWAQAALIAVAVCLIAISANAPRPFQYLVPLCVAVVAALGLLFVRPIAILLNRWRGPSLLSSYAMAWAACVVIVALVPAAGFFRVAYDLHGNLSTRRQQVQTMKALALREEREKAQYRSVVLIESPDGTAPASDADQQLARWLFLRRRLDLTLDRYDGVVLEAGSGQRFSPDFTASKVTAVLTGPDRIAADCDDDLTPFLTAFAAIHIYDTGAFTTAMAQPVSPRSTWHWCRDELNRLQLLATEPVEGTQASLAATALNVDHRSMRQPSTRALLKSVTADPVFLHSELISELPLLDPWPTPLTLGAFLGLTFCTFAWMRPTIRQLFLFGIESPDPLPLVTITSATPLCENLILLTIVGTEATTTLRARSDVHYVDVAEIVGGKDVDFSAIEAPAIVLDHFDTQNGDPQATAKKLDLLQRLEALHPVKPVIIVSSVDPVFFFECDSEISKAGAPAAAAPGADAGGWARVVARFGRRRVDERLPEQPLTRGRLIWSTCTTAERMVMDQLARDGWVNPQNKAALNHLQLRGLIGGRPLRFADAGLGQYVSEFVGPSDRRAWHEQSQSTWDGIRLTFVVLMMAIVAAALFVSQQSVLGLTATVAGILTPLTRLLTEANSFRSLIGLGQTKESA
jgi:hypothetical protein